MDTRRSPKVVEISAEDWEEAELLVQGRHAAGKSVSLSSEDRARLSSGKTGACS